MDENNIVPSKHQRLKFSHVLIILLLIGIGAFAYHRFSLKSKLQSKTDAIRAAGFPVTCAELDQWYKIPPNVENAAYTIIDAFSYYNQWDKEKSKSLPVVGRAELPARTEPLAEEMKALIAEYVADNNEALELLHAGFVEDYYNRYEKHRPVAHCPGRPCNRAVSACRRKAPGRPFGTCPRLPRIGPERPF